jgi:hypothetical protein
MTGGKFSRREWLRTVSAAGIGILGVETSSGQNEQSPTEITDWNDLDAVRDDLKADYQLVSDLDAETEGYDDVASPDANGKSGFNPIGSDEDSFENNFAGTFAGNGHTIADLTIDRPATGSVGLFAVSETEIRNLRLEQVDLEGNENTGGAVGRSVGTIQNVTVSGNIVGGDYTGGVVGSSTGKIQDCTSTGTVSGSSYTGGVAGETFETVQNSGSTATVTGEDNVGGVVGLSFGEVAQCEATGSVTATGEFIGSAGGLVGSLVSNDSTVVKSSAVGDVNGSELAGGLVGQNGGVIVDSYAQGNVNSASSAGGLVGENDDLDPGTVTRSYATGEVTGSISTGGLVGSLGDSSSDNITDSYWDTVATGQNDPIGTTNDVPSTVIGLDTSEMQGQTASENMSAFGFGEVWVALPESYPILQWQFTEPVADAGDDQSVQEETTVTLDASGSIASDGSTLSYSWTQTAGPEVSITDATTVTPEFKAPTVETERDLIFEVTVEDENASDTDSTTVTVIPVNEEPIADAGEDRTVAEGMEVELDATESSDPDDTTLSYSWTQTAGPTVSLTDAGTATPEFTTPLVEDQATLTFEVSVTDGDVSDTDSVSITIDDNQPPVLPGQENLPQDIDDDGVYEDLDGDGDLTLLDVRLYYQELYLNSDSKYVQNNRESFDVDGDGEITLADVQALFDKRNS